jgi:N-acetylmuramoyl-L-alanine amidase
MGVYTVRQGDCISSIASKNGLFWESLWNHADNSELKRNRQDPNALLPGDKVFVPEKEKASEDCATESKHRFRALGVPAKMKVRLLVNEEPRANEKFRLYVDDVLLREGKTDGDGFIEEPIPPDCRSGNIVIYDDDENEEHYPFDFGSVDPLETEEGVKKRLFNLGYDVEDLSKALGEFQQKQDLEETKTIDEATRNELEDVFGQ